MESSDEVDRHIGSLDNKPFGLFLVRLNTGENMPVDKAPFTIARVVEDGKVVHTRIYIAKSGGFMIKINEGKIFESTQKLSLKEFIATVQKSSLLTKPCPGSPFTPWSQSAYEEAPDPDST